ncbi:MAG: hypothetical protein Fur0037_12410 [Planctomycetota bacterium]
MAWWREARFGMFIHWGLYSIPAGEWNGQKNHAEWIRTTARIPLAEYEKLRARFDPVEFDADEWAAIAADAGMKYLVITSKHHDGFCLFDSEQTDWDVGGTPFGRDVLDELSKACARHGIRFGTYHSIMDWHHPDYLPRRPWETDRPAEGADFDRFERYLHAQVTELVRRYHPAIMWFDGEWENTWTHERGVRLFDLCRKLDPMMIVNNRVDVMRSGMDGFNRSEEARGDFSTPEQQIPATGMPGVDWETCMTMNDHWGYNRFDANWKSTQDLLRKLCDIASKGGNFLLNVGPRADGTFPPQAKRILKEVGEWMRANGDAIYETQASPFDFLPFGRCTVRREKDASVLNLLVFDWPTLGRLVVPGVGNRPIEATLRGRRLPVSRRGADIVIDVPPVAPDPRVSLVELRIEGEPVVYRTPDIEAIADEFVDAAIVRLSSGSPALEVHYTLDGSDPDVSSPVATGPITLRASASMTARSFHDGKPVSPAAVRKFTKVDPIPAAKDRGATPGLDCAVYKGSFDSMPDFASLTTAAKEIMSTVALPPGHAAEREARKAIGFLDVPGTGLYEFELTSDDGSQLLVDGRMVVDLDGLHAAIGKRGTAPLSKGPHAIEVRWFNKTGGLALSLRWAKAGEPLQQVPGSALSH